MFSGLGDLTKMMKEAQKLKQRMEEKQAEIARMEITGSSGGGMVQVTVTGDQQVRSIRIEKEVIDPSDPGMLQDLLTAAVNDALAKSKELVQKELSSLTGGLNLPGLM